jgi:hypothetical protein
MDRNIRPEFNLLGFGLNAHCRETRGDNLRGIQHFFVERCLTELDFGDIEHVGNDFEKMLSGAEDVAGIFPVDRLSDAPISHP